MKESIIQEALALFEQRGDKAIDEINAIQNMYEYKKTIDEYRTVDKLALIYNEYSKSPEDILIKKEEHLYLLHFVCWLKKYLSLTKPNLWETWRDSVIFGLDNQTLAKKYKVKPQAISKRKNFINKLIKKALPLYYEQYLNLEEYLKG